MYDQHELLMKTLPMAARVSDVRSAALLAAIREPAVDRADLRQELALALLIAIRKFDGRRAGLRTFVERLASTCFTSILRRAKAKKRVAGDDIARDDVHIAFAIELRIDIGRIMQKLAPQDRKVWKLLLDYSPSEVAQLLRIPRSAVYRSMARIRAAFRDGGYR